MSNDLKRTIHLFYFSKFLVGLRFFIPIWLIFGKKFLNVPQLGLLDAATYALIVLIDIPSGALADLIGRRTVIIGGWLLVAISHIGQGFAGTPLIYILFGLLSVASAFVSGADTALIYDNLKANGQQEKFTEVNSKGLFAFRIGIIIASFSGGFLYTIQSWVPFFCMGMAELINVICWYFMKEVKMTVSKFSFNSYLSQIKDGINQVFRNSYTEALSIFYVIIGGITFSSMYFFSSTYAVDLGFNAIEQSFLFGFTNILKALIVIVFVKFAHHITKKQMIILFSVFMIFSYLPAAFVGKNIAVIIITLTEVIAIARFAFLDKYINDEFSSSHRATALSFINMMVNIIYLIIVSVGGFVAFYFKTAGLYTLLGLIVLVFLIPTASRLLKANYGLPPTKGMKGLLQ